MKKFLDSNKVIHEFNEKDFNEEGQVINKITQKIIEENNLVETTEEEIKKIQENQEKETTERKEILEAQDLTNFYEKFQKLIELGVIQ